MSGTAVVTGAASGLGRAIAHRFAKEGIKVALWDLDPAGARRVAEEIGGEPASVSAEAASATGRAGGGRAT